jgi:NifU-like protein involved in Fe-S cluster formation
VEDAKILSFGCAVTIASASVLTETIKGKEISKPFWGAYEEVVQRLMSLIESELREMPPVKLHSPPATVQVFLEAVEGYLDKEGKAELSSRVKGLIPKISEYYKRGEEKE